MEPFFEIKKLFTQIWSNICGLYLNIYFILVGLLKLIFFKNSCNLYLSIK